jgi:hypothetical protein
MRAIVATVCNCKFTLIEADLSDRLFFIYITFAVYLGPRLLIVNASFSVIVPCSNCGYLVTIQ